MRVTEKAVAIVILAFSAWAILMSVATSFQGFEANRILRVELGSDAANLNRAVAGPDGDAVAHNVEMVVRNTYLDFVFILLYWLTFVSLAVLAGRLGERVLAACAALLITGAALSDLLENGAILTAMRVRPFTDAVAVDISEYSQWKWSFFFLAAIVLGLAIALNRRVSRVRRLSGGLFVASGVFGLLGVARCRVALEFSLWMIDFGILMLIAALMVMLWKLYHSLKELDRIERMAQVHAHA